MTANTLIEQLEHGEQYEGGTARLRCADIRALVAIRDADEAARAVLERELSSAEHQAAIWHDAGGSSPETNDANYYRFDGIAFGLRLALRVLNGGAA